MEVKALNSRPLGPVKRLPATGKEPTGVRRGNNILLFSNHFDTFHRALMSDDFPLCREILGGCLDLDPNGFTMRPGWIRGNDPDEAGMREYQRKLLG